MMMKEMVPQLTQDLVYMWGTLKMVCHMEKEN